MQGRKGGEKYLMLSLFEVDMMRKGKETKHILGVFINKCPFWFRFPCNKSLEGRRRLSFPPSQGSYSGTHNSVAEELQQVC